RNAASPPPAPEAPPAPLPQPTPAPPVAASPPAPSPPTAPTAPPDELAAAPQLSNAATAPGPVVEPRASSGGLLIGSSEPVKRTTDHSTKTAERRRDEPPIQPRRRSVRADRSRGGRGAVDTRTVAAEATARPARSAGTSRADDQ